MDGGRSGKDSAAAPAGDHHDGIREAQPAGQIGSRMPRLSRRYDVAANRVSIPMLTIVIPASGMATRSAKGSRTSGGAGGGGGASSSTSSSTSSSSASASASSTSSSSPAAEGTSGRRYFVTASPSNSTLSEFAQILETSFHCFCPTLAESNGALTATTTSSMNVGDLWGILQVQMMKGVKVVFDFSRQIPGFTGHPLENQVDVIQKGMVPMVAMALARSWDFGANQFNWFSLTYRDMEKIITEFRPFRNYLPLLKRLSEAVKKLDLDTTETSLMCALFFHDLVNDYQYKELIIDCIIWYSRNKKPHDRTRHVRILSLFRSFFNFYLEHDRIMTGFYSNPAFSSFTTTVLPFESLLDN